MLTTTLRGGGGGGQGSVDSSPETLAKDMNIEGDTTKNGDPWVPLGGGAVNEKQRQIIPSDYYSTPSVATAQTTTTDTETNSLQLSGLFQPSTHRAHLYHALEGLDRYPNYLHRWSMDDIDRLEEALEEQLSLIRSQRANLMDKRASIHNLVQELNQDGSWNDLLQVPISWDDVQQRILHERASAAIFGSKTFRAINKNASSVELILSGKTNITLDIAKLTQWMDEECFDVYSFPLLSTEFCKRVRDYLIALTDLAHQSKNTTQLQQQLVGRRPFDLDSIGLSWLNDLLLHLIIRPISRPLFQSTESKGELDWRHGFVAAYSATPQVGKPRERLVAHTDDSEVTLNVGLGDVFEGGEVEFRGLRDGHDQGELLDSIAPRPGVALLHAGRHLHDVTQITQGDRYALIVWARSWNGVRSNTCPCCWLNRRQDESCICGRLWN
jgi:hypothetical protein